MTIRVLIADAQHLIRSGLRSLLNASDGFYVVADVENGAEAVSAAREYHPDIAIMDLVMPYADGVGGTLQLMRAEQSTRVLALSPLECDDLIFEALGAGVAGCLLKDTTEVELLAAVRTIAAGGSVLSPQVLSKIVNRARVHMHAGSSKLMKRIDSLPESERMILKLVGAGYPNQKIAKELHLSLSSVKTYTSRIFTRLGLQNRTQAAILAYRSGLIGNERSCGGEPEG
ncbi:response regulator transcription factor (plasmid) [Streptomyces murinus]|uniref:response regulator n=1 Tax=Streptomyces murinus TaxID=33900 RepID=UPI000A1EE6B5|nr:response regulator transcription factor [Streptomyces murinus]WDO11359.1 response regulator transcription factor [Streptomyces murinus]